MTRIADAELWLPSSKQLIADGLLDALTERASVQLVGEPDQAPDTTKAFVNIESK